MSNEIKVGFGLADVTVDGKDMGLQGDAATFTAEPIMLEVDTYEAGVWDYYIDGWDVSLSVTFQDENFEKLKMALPTLDELKENGEVVGLTDGGMHQRIRNRAVEVKVHPRDAGDDTSTDVTIFKAVPVGVFERVYGKEVAGYQVEFKGLPVSGDVTKGGNFFRIGNDGIEDDGGYDPEG